MITSKAVTPQNKTWPEYLGGALEMAPQKAHTKK